MVRGQGGKVNLPDSGYIKDYLRIALRFIVANETRIPTSLIHRGFTLIGASFLTFEIGFLILYADKFWFAWDLSPWGLACMLLAIGLSHFGLLGLQTKSAANLLRFLTKGQAPVVYTTWLWLGDETQPSEAYLRSGARYVLIQAIDRLEQTFFGNLIVGSRAICGTHQTNRDTLLKLPSGAISAKERLAVIDRLQVVNPQILINLRLWKSIEVKEPKNAIAVQFLGLAFMACLLLDLGQASFNLLEVLKNYHLCLAQAQVGNLSQAQIKLERADTLMAKRLPFSLVNSKLFDQGTVAANLHGARAEAFFGLGKKKEAIWEANKALELKPDSFRANLRLARFYTANGEPNLAKEQILKAIENHENSFLPRLYMLSLLRQTNRNEAADKMRQVYLTEFKETVFTDEPQWPPGGNRFLHELFYWNDLEFIFNDLRPANIQDTKKSI
jgi:tetratricopeptide (TPR) repeat protein